MPNDCYNVLTVTSETSIDELTKLINNEINAISDVTILIRGNRGIKCEFISAWTPDFNWLETLLENYPTCWIKNEWKEEGGMAGVWIGRLEFGVKQVTNMSWVDLSLEEEYYLFQM